jgi:four helix bundle protein
MPERTYQDLIVWQRAKHLVLETYTAMGNCHDYAFRDQLQRASVSVMNNIAEGFARHGNKTFRHFLLIARGSAGETESMLILARELSYIDQETYDRLVQQANELLRLLTKFAKSLQSK